MAGVGIISTRVTAATQRMTAPPQPKISYKPFTENIITGNLDSLPEKLRVTVSQLYSSAERRGLRKEVDEAIVEFKNLDNEYLVYFLKRLDNAITCGAVATTADVKNMIGMMREHPEAADSVPQLLVNMQERFGGRFCSLSTGNISCIVRATIRKSQSLCPDDMSNTMVDIVRSGELNNIEAAKELSAELNSDSGTQHIGLEIETQRVQVETFDIGTSRQHNTDLQNPQQHNAETVVPITDIQKSDGLRYSELLVAKPSSGNDQLTTGNVMFAPTRIKAGNTVIYQDGIMCLQRAACDVTTADVSIQGVKFLALPSQSSQTKPVQILQHKHKIDDADDTDRSSLTRTPTIKHMKREKRLTRHADMGVRVETVLRAPKNPEQKAKRQNEFRKPKLDTKNMTETKNKHDPKALGAKKNREKKATGRLRELARSKLVAKLKAAARKILERIRKDENKPKKIKYDARNSNTKNGSREEIRTNSTKQAIRTHPEAMRAKTKEKAWKKVKRTYRTDMRVKRDEKQRKAGLRREHKGSRNRRTREIVQTNLKKEKKVERSHALKRNSRRTRKLCEMERLGMLMPIFRSKKNRARILRMTQ